MANQSIQDFYRVAQERGFARDFMMRVRAIGDDTLNEDDFIYITTKILPDRKIANQPVPFMGLKFNVPGTVDYAGSDAWVVKFRNDLNGVIRKKLEDWQTNKIFNDETTTGDLSLRGRDKLIHLDLVDENLNVLNTYKLYSAYIVSIGSVAYDATGDGKPTEFDATLAYSFWRHT